MKLTIITINFNNQEGLERTVQSVINQSWKDFEYIVIDGGSTDGSKEYIESHQEYFDYWVSEPDSGIYNAMNKGIKKAKGQYVQFLNSGDWLYNNSVLKLAIDKLSGEAIIYGNLLKMFDNGKTKLDKGPNGNSISLLTFFKGTINHGSTFIKKDLFERYGYYDENLSIVSDWKFFFETVGLHAESTKYYNALICCFDMNGMSNLNLDLRNRERIKVIKELLPETIIYDYNKLVEFNTIMNSSKFPMLLKIENFNFTRKLNAVWVRLLYFLFIFRK